MAMRDQYDVAVIGGGFFGLSLAAFLAHQGYTTVVFERGSDLCSGPHTLTRLGSTTAIITLAQY